MNNNQNAEALSENINAKSVAEFLKEHPQFFLGQSELLAGLNLPYGSSGTISLIERQVRVLREQKSVLKTQLDQLLVNARENEALIVNLQNFALALLHSDDAVTVFKIIERALIQDFQADAVSIRLFGHQEQLIDAMNQAQLGNSGVIGLEDAVMSELSGFIEAASPLCGDLAESVAQVFFATGAAPQSVVQIPLVDDSGPLGIIIIGSDDGQRFQADMDTHFLKFMVDLIVTKLVRFH